MSSFSTSKESGRKKRPRSYSLGKEIPGRISRRSKSDPAALQFIPGVSRVPQCEQPGCTHTVTWLSQPGGLLATVPHAGLARALKFPYENTSWTSVMLHRTARTAQQPHAPHLQLFSQGTIVLCPPKPSGKPMLWRCS